MSPSWRLLIDDGAGAAAGLATDEALLSHYGGGSDCAFTATLRLYTYRPHCALVGRYQSLDEEIDLEACAREGAEFGRRPTGGGAILMGPDQLGVALALPAQADETPRATLARLATGVIAGLSHLGVEAHFRSKNDLETGGRKIAGLGLYRDERGALLFHSSVLVDLDLALMLRLLRIPGAKLADKGAARVADRVTTVHRELGSRVGLDPVRRAVAAGMADTFGVTLVPDTLDPQETARRDELIAHRYGDREWLWQRSARVDREGTALLKTPEGLLRIHVGLHGPTIKSVLLAGDFNTLPAALPELESALRWHRADERAIAATVTRHLPPEALGVPPVALAGAIWEAVNGAIAAQAAGLPVRSAGSCYFPEPASPAGRDPVTPS